MSALYQHFTNSNNLPIEIELTIDLNDGWICFTLVSVLHIVVNYLAVNQGKK